MPTILFNGKTYNSIEEMPVDVRSAYQQVADIFVDKNGNGIPDFLEGDMVKNVITAFTSNVNVNGQTYNNMNELPPDICAQVQGAFEKLSALGMVTNNNSPRYLRRQVHKLINNLSHNRSPSSHRNTLQPFKREKAQARLFGSSSG